LADHGFFDDGVDGYPFRVAQSGNRRVLQGGEHAEHGRQIVAMNIEKETDFACAAMAPWSIRIRFSAFSRFQASAAAARFMMNTVADSSTVSTMRKRFARRDAPFRNFDDGISKLRNFYFSCAQENSTRAFTPCARGVLRDSNDLGGDHFAFQTAAS